jgi:hypothetical protein
MEIMVWHKMYINFWSWPKKFGRSQKFLGPVEEQGMAFLFSFVLSGFFNVFKVAWHMVDFENDPTIARHYACANDIGINFKYNLLLKLRLTRVPAAPFSYLF